MFRTSKGDSKKAPNLLHVLYQLQHDQGARPEKVDGTGLSPYLVILRRWQSERLAQTYSDLLSTEQTRPACRFFLEEIYSARDFTQRDADFDRLHTLLSRFLPEKMLQPLSESLDLNHLSSQLDSALLNVLVEENGFHGDLTPEMYVAAYRRCDNYPLRVEQIERLVAILTEIGAGTKLPLVKIGLKLAKKPAFTAGWQELYGFLERGYAAFKPMQDVAAFAERVRTRELMILDRIYSRHPHPFDLNN